MRAVEIGLQAPRRSWELRFRRFVSSSVDVTYRRLLMSIQKVKSCPSSLRALGDPRDWPYAARPDQAELRQLDRRFAAKPRRRNRLEHLQVVRVTAPARRHRDVLTSLVNTASMPSGRSSPAAAACRSNASPGMNFRAARRTNHSLGPPAHPPVFVKIARQCASHHAHAGRCYRGRTINAKAPPRRTNDSGLLLEGRFLMSADLRAGSAKAAPPMATLCSTFSNGPGPSGP